jgi:hydroxypyruvate isomerase
MSKSKYSRSFDNVLVVVDIFMVILVIINLLMMAIQLNFESDSVRALIEQYAYPFYQLYLPIYKNFIFIDGIFVAVFIAEIFIRWGIAIYNKTYHRWFFYPFARWYEVLGCIPISSFRALRILRVIAIIVRLNRMKIIDIKQWYLYKVFSKYLNVITEEVSDRVVVNVIEGIQQEVKTGIPLTERILKEVIVPRKTVLVNYLAHRVQQVTKDQYATNKEDLRASIREAVSTAIQQNQNIRVLEQVPMVGKVASVALQQSVYDITFQTINHVIEKMASEESRMVIEKIADGIIEAILIEEEDTQLQTTFNDMIIHSLDLVKEQVQVQQWKAKEQTN